MGWGSLHDAPTSMQPKLPSSEPFHNVHPKIVMSVAIDVGFNVEKVTRRIKTPFLA